MQKKLLKSAINSGNTESKRCESDLRESDISQMLTHLLSPNEMFDGAIEIVISRPIPTQTSPHPRQNMREIQVIPPCQEARRGIRQLQNHQFAPILQHAVHLLQTTVKVGEIAHAKSTRDGSKRCVRKRNTKRRCLSELHLRFRKSLGDLFFPDRHHPFAEVNSDNALRFPLFEHLQRKVCRTHRHIQDSGSLQP